MIKFLNKHSFCYMTASGAMGYDGRGRPHEQPLRRLGLLDISLFTHVMKTVTFNPRRGNYRWHKPWDCIRLIWDGLEIIGAHNAYGLTNPGFWWWCRNIGPKTNSSEISLIGSIFGEPDELGIMAEALNAFDLVGLEYNASCPNAGDDTLSNSDKIIRSCEIVAKKSRHPVLIKLSVVHDIEKIVPAVEGMVAAFDINSVPWRVIFPNRPSPLAKYGGGGVSGKIAQPFTWSFAERLKTLTKVPVIAPSIWEYKDLEIMRSARFEAFSFGSIFLVHPCRPTLYARRDIKKNGIN